MGFTSSPSAQQHLLHTLHHHFAHAQPSQVRPISAFAGVRGASCEARTQGGHIHHRDGPHRSCHDLNGPGSRCRAPCTPLPNQPVPPPPRLPVVLQPLSEQDCHRQLAGWASFFSSWLLACRSAMPSAPLPSRPHGMPSALPGTKPGLTRVHALTLLDDAIAALTPCWPSHAPLLLHLTQHRRPWSHLDLPPCVLGCGRPGPVSLVPASSWPPTPFSASCQDPQVGPAAHTRHHPFLLKYQHHYSCFLGARSVPHTLYDDVSRR